MGHGPNTAGQLSHNANHQLYMNATQGRKNCLLPGTQPYFGRDWVQTTNVPMPGAHGGGCGWAEKVDEESALRAFQNRDTQGGCNDLRSLQIPLAWSMTPLIHQWQQDDDFSRVREHTRMMIADTCRPLPTDKIGYYDTRNCRQRIDDCRPQYPQQTVWQYRMAYP